MPSIPSDTPVCDLDFYGADAVADPVSHYGEMLKLGPVVWLKPNNMYAICGHAEVVATLRDHARFSSARGVSVSDSVNKLLIGSTLNSDPPQHDATRKITFAPLSPKNLHLVKDRIEREALYIVEKILAKRTFDSATELAPYLPLSVVRDLVGLGEYGKDHMLEWGAATFELMGNPKDRREAAVDKLKRLRGFLENPEILNNLSVDGWAKRATRLGIESGMEPSRAVELMRDYIAPSLDTTISAIGYGIKLFAENPDQWTALRDNRELMRNAIEEIVRMNSPIRAFTRYVTEDVVIAGSKLEKGTRALIVFGAANRDASRFPDPNQFDIKRKTTGHLGFGQGVHACLGMNLARLEMTCLFNRLADSVVKFELTGPVVAGVNSTIHSYRTVPVKAIL